jgi:hypothetical protein
VRPWTVVTSQRFHTDLQNYEHDIDLRLAQLSEQGFPSPATDKFLPFAEGFAKLAAALRGVTPEAPLEHLEFFGIDCPGQRYYVLGKDDWRAYYTVEGEATLVALRILYRKGSRKKVLEELQGAVRDFQRHG